MNERLQELAEQAENYAAEQNDKFGVSYKKTYNQKFAELIAKECAITAYLCSHADCHSGDEFIHAGDKIRKHFGVEDA